MIWTLFIILLLTLLLNYIILKYGFNNLEYKMITDKKTYEIEEKIKITSIFKNKKFLSISFLSVKEIFPEGFNLKSNKYNLLILPFQKVERTYLIKGTSRGKYKLNEVNLELGDFLGFKNKYKTINMEKYITILPKKEKLKNLISSHGSLYGDISIKRWILEDPLMTISVREYTGNEPVKYIHWPSSIKYNDLMVKQFDFTTDNSAEVFLNIESSKPYWKNIDKKAIEKSIIITRSILEEFENEKIPYGFGVNTYLSDNKNSKGIFYYPSFSKNNLNKYLKILGEINYIISSSFEKTLLDIIRLKNTYNTLVIVTPKVFDSYIKPLNSASRIIGRIILITIHNDNLNKLDKNIVTYKGVEEWEY